MACSCIKNNFDFYLTEVACRHILYTDLSVWMTGDRYSTPSEYDIEIEGNKYTVKTAGVTKLDLKDGVYPFIVQSCDKIYTRWAAVTAKLQCCLDAYIVDNEFPNKEKALEAQRLIDGVKIYAAFNKPDIAKDYYKAAKKLIEHLNCDCQ